MGQHVGRGSARSPVARMLFCILFAVSLAGCVQQSSEKEERRPQQAGEPLDPIKTAGRFGAMRASALTGDQDGFKRNFESMHGDLMRSMRVPDAPRRINARSPLGGEKNHKKRGPGTWPGAASSGQPVTEPR